MFCGTHAKTHGVRGLIKHYHLQLDPKLGNGKCVIRPISCECIACTDMLDEPWVIGIDPNRQARYQPIGKLSNLIINQQQSITLMQFIKFY